MCQDFDAFLSELGITQAQMDDAAKTIDPIPRRFGEPYFVNPSSIQGVGIFSDRHIEKGMDIGRFKSCEGWTVSGAYTNHSKDPNLIADWREGEIHIQAFSDIGIGEEMTINYRQVRNLMMKNEVTDHG